MGISVNLDNIPQQTTTKLAEGIYVIEVEDIVEDKTKDGGDKLMMSHKVVNTNVKVNYDNYAITTGTGEPHLQGQGKLRTLIEAAKITGISQVTTAILKQLLVGKRVKAKLTENDRGYLQVNYSDIYPLDDSQPALNETGTNKPNTTEKDVSPASFEQPEVDINDI